ncbi:MAG: CoB--CoM heterodisulfide reductase iron-sulfur subunit A family protein [Deltaproteobacteria bacterium]|nr:CoB--CoM heterodisulfide reductase iron-sulfur subunit A family protein [Deltaproteobacteria bacterium]MBW2662261.1 CoB--CoM heterodisulfide reductase iron-sulfur subunit A family protein [Deltaproteobacteria bacterium]
MPKDKTGSVMVVGGGVAGMQAALDLANAGYYVYLVERLSSIGGMMSQLDKTFPTNDCAMCIISPKLVEVGRHINIELLTLAGVNSISGEEGNFEVSVTQYPRYVDTEKCIACGLCAEKCPKKVPDEYDGGLSKRKAIYVKYPQAVPLKYAIDAKHCIYFIKGKCRICEKFCPNNAINFNDQKKELILKVGAVVLSMGTKVFDPGVHDVYGYKKYPNIVTSLEFERILSASGPYGGHLVRPSDQKEPKKIAWLQCVGSRDECLGAKGYCSAVCCTYAIKEAMLAKEHSKGDLDAAIFYIDIRTQGKDFERYFNRAKDESGIRFIKSKITGIPFVNGTGRHLIRYVNEAGRKVEEEFDMVVLSVGLGVTRESADLAQKLGIKLDHYNFAVTSSFDPVQSSRPGVYVCGAFQSPKDIPSSVIDSSAAAGVAGSKLAGSRWTLTGTKHIPKEIDIRGEPPRVGVFVCRCGTNIAGTVDVPSLVEFARELRGVVYVEENMFTCSQDTQNKITRVIKEQRLNRVVVAACTPKTHEPLFQETLINAGVNKYLFEMANIRNMCSWVHKNNPEQATEKAKDLIRMAVSKVVLLGPLTEPVMEIKQTALVVGGGVAGMVAAKNLADQNYKTFLIERTGILGGQAWHLHETWRGENVQEYLAGLIKDVESNKNIEIFLNIEIEQVDGFAGNFKTTIQHNAKSKVLEHGVTIIASGASALKPDQYFYGEDNRVITGLELQQRLIDGDSSMEQLNTVAFVQCVGSRIEKRPYCSKVCCTQSIKSALKLKEINPKMNVFVLYRDMRSYGLREDLYRKARYKGINFVRYDFDKEFTVTNDNSELRVTFNDCVLRRQMEVRPDLLVLASAIVPEKKNPLAQFYKIPQNDDGFFVEAHVKLRPVDFATDGVFLCGLAHAPKTIDESITQAQAAAARAVTLLSAMRISVSGTVAYVDPNCCSSCGVCVSICPYSAPNFNDKSGKAEIESALCKGCGLCAASCRSGAIHLKGFDDNQIFAQISAL